MIMEMSDPLAVHRQNLRFSDVVKQHGQAKHLIRPHMTQRVQNMLSHIIAMVNMPLFRLHGPVKLREKHFCDANVISSPQILRMGRNHQLHQLCLDSLGADAI